MDNRPILIITIGYIIGIIWGLYFKKNIAPFFAVIILIVLCVMSYIFFQNNSIMKRIKGINITNFILLLLSCIISFSIINYKEYRYDNLFKNLDEEIKYNGIVIGEQKESQYYYNYILKVESVNGNHKYANTKFLLKLKKQNNSYKFEYGDYIQGKGIISKPECRRNYKEFDYSKYLKTKDISIICESNPKQVKIIKRKSIFVINMWIHNIRNQIKNNLAQLIKNDNYEVAVALLLGESNLLNDNQKEMYSNANVSHILAISGMHVSYVILACSFIFKKFGKSKCRYISIVLLVIFSIFTGNSPSVLRAVIMGILMIMSKLFYRKSDIINNIAISCLIILLINPYNILNLGFQLSFIGTLSIVLFYKKIKKFIDSRINIKNKIFNKTKDIVIVSISANVLIFPIVLYNYNNVSIVFLFSNILVTPILGFMLFCGYLTAFSSIIHIKLAKFFAAIFNFFLDIFNLISKISSNLFFIRAKCVTPSVIMLLLYYFIIIYIVFFYKKKHLKILKSIIVLFVFFSLILNTYQFLNPKLKIYFVDVGQGDCTLIVTNSNKKILIDGGGSDSYDVGKNVLIPYLLDRKIMKIDYMVISHFDSDHVGGLLTVMQELKVNKIIIGKQGEGSKNYQKFKDIVKEKNIKVFTVGKGDRINIEKDLYIDVLWPNKLDLINENILNNNSIVCKLCYRNVSILFTGDIEEISEKQLLSEYNNNLKIFNSTILKVAHHGSKTSSTIDFLNAIKPKIALIGVGKNNKFGHPNDDIIERLKNIRKYSI